MAQPWPCHSWPPACPRLPSSGDFAKDNLLMSRLKTGPCFYLGAFCLGGCNTQGCAHPPSSVLPARPMNRKTAQAAGGAACRDQF